jgi:hypothetical protein
MRALIFGRRVSRPASDCLIVDGEPLAPHDRHPPGRTLPWESFSAAICKSRLASTFALEETA